MAASGHLERLLKEDYSPRFAAALLKLLSAYREDLDAATQESRAEQAAAAGEPCSVVGGVRSEWLQERGNGFERLQERAEPRRGATSSDGCKDVGTSVAQQASPKPEIAALPADGQVSFTQPCVAELAAPGPEATAIGASVAGHGAPAAPEVFSPLGPEPDIYGAADESEIESPTRGPLVSSLSTVHRKHLKGLVSKKQIQRDQTFVERIAASPYFERASAVVTLFFCLLTALEMQKEGLDLGYELSYPHHEEQIHENWTKAGHVFLIMTYFFVSTIIFEVCFRLLVLRRAFVQNAWNFFDISIILSWAIEVGGYRLYGNVGSIRVVSMLRLLRFFKLFKFIGQIDVLYLLLKALYGCLKVLIWCCLLLCAIQTVTAFIITQWLFAFYFPYIDSSQDQEVCHLVFRYYGSFSRSLLTSFELALGNWPVPARVLFENISEWFVFLIILHKLTVGFSVIGIINSIFVQETLQLANLDDHTMVLKKKKQAKALKDKLDRLFQAMDCSQDGTLCLQEFKEVLKHSDVITWLASMEYDCHDPDSFFELLDTDHDGILSTNEFFSGMASLRGQAKAIDLLKITDKLNELKNASAELKVMLSAKGQESAGPPVSPTRDVSSRRAYREMPFEEEVGDVDELPLTRSWRQTRRADWAT